MKVRVVVDVGDYERFVIAKFWAPVGTAIDKKRSRATRAQVRRFALAMLRRAVKDHERDLAPRSRKSATRIAAGAPPQAVEQVPAQNDNQRRLTW